MIFVSILVFLAAYILLEFLGPNLLLVSPSQLRVYRKVNEWNRIKRIRVCTSVALYALTSIMTSLIAYSFPSVKTAVKVCLLLVLQLAAIDDLRLGSISQAMLVCVYIAVAAFLVVSTPIYWWVIMCVVSVLFAFINVCGEADIPILCLIFSVGIKSVLHSFTLAFILGMCYITFLIINHRFKSSVVIFKLGRHKGVKLYPLVSLSLSILFLLGV